MNERLKQLAEQAKVDVGTLFAEMLCNDSEVNVKIAEVWNSQPQEVRTRIFLTIEQNQKKFAELIIQECLNIMQNCDGDLGFAIFKTKKQFGVEE